MSYPTYVIIDNERYDINTDFRVAIKCNKIAEDSTIMDEERALAIIFLLFGEKGLKAHDHHEKLKEYALRFLRCDKEIKITDEEPDMDYIEDMSYIKASFRSDYGIRLDDEKMHWWEFSELMNGLSNSELGSCCILNRIRNFRNFDPKTIEDKKERDRIIKIQQEIALKKNRKEYNLTKEQEESMNRLNEILGL